MSDVPVTDWNMIHRWEWFRRADWRPDFRGRIKGEGGGSCRAFCDLAKLTGVDVALDCSCGLGKKTIIMNEMGLNVLGSDHSEEAITHARELADLEGVNLNFFPSAWDDLPHNVPHHFGAVFNDALAWAPTWDDLGSALVGIFHILQPGGFLMFMGASENAPDNSVRQAQETEWREQPREYVEWFSREGSTLCANLVQKTRADDYIDDRHLYVVSENGKPRLESTTLRRPAYWTYQHFVELTRTAGFCHLETRTYERYGHDGGPIRLNVAWKSKDGSVNVDTAARNAPYQD